MESRSSLQSRPDKLADVEKSERHQHVRETGSRDVDSDGSDAALDPIDWPKKYKWSVVSILSCMSLADNQLYGTLLVSIWELGEGIGPLVVGPLSEMYGRRITYNCANLVYVIFNVLNAVSVNIAMLITMRFLNGAANAITTLNPCVVGDLFVQEERGLPMALINLPPLLGPIAGPIIGGFVAEAAGWRWVFGTTAIFAALCAVIFAFTFKETYRPEIVRRTARRSYRSGADTPGQQPTRESAAPKVKQSLIRPLRLLLFSPMVTCLTIYYSIAYGYVYILVTTLSSVFEDVYHFSDGIVGLTYVGLGIGIGLAVLTCIFTLDRIVRRHKAAGRAMLPEHRLPILVGGSIALVAGLLLYGWSAEARLLWIVPILGTVFIGFGITATQISINTYLIDAFPLHGASAMAALGILRSVTAAALPLIGPPMYDALGLGWGNSLLGFVAAVGIPISLFLMRYGERIRKKSKLNGDVGDLDALSP